MNCCSEFTKTAKSEKEEWLASLTAKILEADNGLLSMTNTRSENQFQVVVKMDGNTFDAASN